MEQVRSDTQLSPFFTAAEAAIYLRLEESTLNAMRWRKEGPCWRKHGGKVVYHKSELDRWSQDRDSNPENRPKNKPKKGDDDKSDE